MITIKDILKEVQSAMDGVEAPEKKAALIIAASNLELAEAQRLVAISIANAGNKISTSLVDVSNSIDRIT